MGRRAKQMALFDRPARGDGGGVVSAGSGRAKRKRKPGALLPGRKPRPERKGFCKHVARPGHDWRHPVHVTMRRVPNAPSFRRQVIYPVVLAEIAVAKLRKVRVVEYSIQHDHLHLMVEGNDREDLSKQMCRLFSRIAMAVNRVARRHGPLFRDRHHRRALATPSEVRNALVYILQNIRKHSAATHGAVARRWLDWGSSAVWFSGWDPNARPPPEAIEQARAYCPMAITSPPDTWLAARGWRRGGRKGPLRFDEQPRAPF